MKRTFSKKSEGLTANGSLDDLARVTCAAGRLEPLDEARPGASQDEMGDRDIAHLTLDHEGESCREIAFQQESVDVTRVIGDHDGVALR